MYNSFFFKFLYVHYRIISILKVFEVLHRPWYYIKSRVKLKKFLEKYLPFDLHAEFCIIFIF